MQSTIPETRRRTPRVIALDDGAATDVGLAGGKAAALARATCSGLPALPGVVLTTAFSDDVDDGAAISSHPAVRDTFDRMRGDEQRLVARSSSVVEDSAASSMAGQFESVIGISGFGEFAAAVTEVLDSRSSAGAADHPIAVLVQPLIEPRFGGVMFGVDPVSGRSDRRVVSAVKGGPEQLVSGEVDGSRTTLDNDDAVTEFVAADGPELSRSELRALGQLSRQAAEIFGSPQDVEWAIDDSDTVFLLQSRPITTEIRGVPSGSIYGPGPVAETFPEPLTELEQDLWIPPLRQGLREAVQLAGAATKSDIAASEIVVAIDGYVAIDLDLAGEIPHRPSIWQRLNPIPAARKLHGAWRIGRLRVALPALAEDLLDQVDRDLEAVPAVDELTDRQLLALLMRARETLASLHGHEILMGQLTDTTGNRMTGASVALRVLEEARRDGLDDDEILRRSPVVLGLTGPKVGSGTDLPPTVETLPDTASTEPGNDAGIVREALRLRVRWTQELTGRAAWMLGERLTDSGVLPRPEAVRHLPLETLRALVTKRGVAVAPVLAAHSHGTPRPLPACFQISDLGRPVMVCRSGEIGGGTGAGGGVGTGVVTNDTKDPPGGSVLVTTTLTPGLGPLLPRLNGIVAETGSVLAHLAILARESDVATVVGYAGAADDLTEGSTVTVNGDNGDVTIEEVG